MHKYLLWIMLAVFLCGTTVTSVGCNEGPLEEAAEEIEDEIDDATNS